MARRRYRPNPGNHYATIFNDAYIHIGDNDPNRPQARTRYHIVMLTGNPGCIGYYREYLTCLWRDLQGVRATADISIYGISLAGFDLRPRWEQGGARGLKEQIEYVEECIQEYIGQCALETDPEVDRRVILVGHSVGGYIGLELIRRHQNQCRLGRGRKFHIIGYIGLWPTVTHLVDSSRGRKVGWLLKLPILAFLMGILAKILVHVLGRSMTATILKQAGFTEQAAEVTVKFLASRNGVYQALYLAGDEMREITIDRWDEDIWGAQTLPKAYPRPRLVFCFGTDDHWVADHYRDQLIRTRGTPDNKEEWRPIMLVDNTGIPHSFCISHSEVVAGMTSTWIHDIIAQDRKRLA